MERCEMESRFPMRGGRECMTMCSGTRRKIATRDLLGVVPTSCHTLFGADPTGTPYFHTLPCLHSLITANINMNAYT